MPKKPITLTVLGGGSFFTPSLVGTMCAKPQVFAGAEDRHAVFQALCIHPFTRSIATAKALYEAMWREERDLLGPYWVA